MNEPDPDKARGDIQKKTQEKKEYRLTEHLTQRPFVTPELQKLKSEMTR